jgi:hypothetical protein
MPSDRWLNLQLIDSTGEPLVNRPYVLTLPDGTRRDGALDREGRLHEQLPLGTERLRLDVAQRCFELEVTGLPPPSTIKGAQERLNQLNYFVGDVDGDLGGFTTQALERFQRDHGLQVSAKLDEATARMLREVHGS